MNYSLKLFSILFFSALLNLSSDQHVQQRIISVSPCLSFQRYEHFNRLVLQSSDSHAEFIDGFNFEWGYDYKLKVKETKIEPMLSDGTQYEYSLVKVVSKTKVPDSTEFRLFIDTNRYAYKLDSSEQALNITLKPINDSVYLYFDRVEIEVPDRLKEKFNKLVQGEISKIGFFHYVNGKRIRLTRL
jgi:hypothetical protein